MMPEWHQLIPMSGLVEESETARKLQLYATSIKTCLSTRLTVKFLVMFCDEHNCILQVSVKIQIYGVFLP